MAFTPPVHSRGFRPGFAWPVRWLVAVVLAVVLPLGWAGAVSAPAQAALHVPVPAPGPTHPSTAQPQRLDKITSGPTDEVIVQLAPDPPHLTTARRATAAPMMQALTRLGFRPVSVIEGVQPRGQWSPQGRTGTDAATSATLQVLRIPAQTGTARALRVLRAQPGVAAAYPNRRYTINASAARAFTPTATGAGPWAGAATNDEFARFLWGLSNSHDIDIDQREAFVRQRGIRRVKVAVLDTGVDINHPDLRGSVWTNSVEVHGKTGVDDDNNGCVDDIHGCNVLRRNGKVYVGPTEDLHGTHVAGTIAATAGNGIGISGVAPGVTVVPVKMIGADGGSTADAITAIRYAKRIGCSIINASWGGYASDPALEREIALSGLLVVAAAGNDGVDVDAVPYYPASFKLSNVISVGALGRDGRLAEWSNYGAVGVDVAAPGVEILSTGPRSEYFVEDGTSMATPHVSAVAALQASRYSSWTPARGAVSLKGAVKRRSSLRAELASAGVINAAIAVGARPVTGVGGRWSGERLHLQWANPTDGDVRSVRVRIARGAGVPTANGGAGVFAGRGTAATLPGLRAGFDYTVAVYAMDARGARSPSVIRISATSISRSSTSSTLGMRLTTKTAGRVLPGRHVRLVRYLASGVRVLCTRTTDARGRARCPTSRGRLQWQAPSAGTYLLRSSNSFTR